VTRAGLLAAGWLALSVAASGEEGLGLVAIDVYGSEQVSLSEIEERLGDRIREFDRATQEEDYERAGELRRELEAELAGMGDFAHVGLSRIQYFTEGRPRYVTVDLVDSVDAAERMSFGPEPDGGPFADPAGLLAAWAEYQAKGFELVSELDIDDVDCPAFHCVFGFGHPELSRFRQLFEEQVPVHREELTAILERSSDANQRANAVFLLAHIDDGKALIELLLPRVRDPSSLVRNNAIRVLDAIAHGHPELDVPLEPALQALRFPTTTDRNKALALLDALAEREELRQQIVGQAGPTLVALLRLRQPNNCDLAYEVLKKLSGRDLDSRDYDGWAGWLREEAAR